MKRASGNNPPSTFSRPSRIDEEAEGENYDEYSSSEDELLPAPVAMPTGSLRSSRSNGDEDDEEDEAELQGRLGSAGQDDDDGALVDDDEEEDVLQGWGDGDREAAFQSRKSHHRRQMKHLMELFDADQMRRYETFRRCAFPRPAIKKLMVRVLEQAQMAGAQQVNQNSVILMTGLAKVFVGECVEEGRRVAEEAGDGTGPIQPSHLLEAQRRLKAAGLASQSALYKRPKNRLL